MGRGLGSSEEDGGDELIWVVIDIGMETTQRIPLYSHL
jgi:hypothetical protein